MLFNFLLIKARESFGTSYVVGSEEDEALIINSLCPLTRFVSPKFYCQWLKDLNGLNDFI
jgi:hypothetical protein